MSPDGADTASAVVLWPGSNLHSTPEQYSMLFDAYQKEVGAPPPLKQGHFSQIYGGANSDDNKCPGYFIYEKASTYEVRFNCITLALQLSCHGEMRVLTTGVYIRSQFPERIIRSDKGWMSVADPAFKFINLWLQENIDHDQ